MIDAEPIYARTNLIACLHLRVLRRECVEKSAVAAAEVADANRALLVADHFEMFARQELIGDADMTLASDHEAAGRNLELLPGQGALQADQNRARCRLDRFR